MATSAEALRGNCDAPNWSFCKRLRATDNRSSCTPTRQALNGLGASIKRELTLREASVVRRDYLSGWCRLYPGPGCLAAVRADRHNGQGRAGRTPVGPGEPGDGGTGERDLRDVVAAAHRG